MSPGGVLLTGTPAGCALGALPPLVPKRMQLALPGPKLWATFTRVQARGPQVLRPGDAVRGTIASADGVINLGEPRQVVEGPTA